MKQGKQSQIAARAVAGPGGDRLAVVSRPIVELTLDPKNPRVHRRPQIRQIARSIEAFGFCVPVLLDRHGHVLAGHGRMLACQELGWRDVPTISRAFDPNPSARLHDRGQPSDGQFHLG